MGTCRKCGSADVSVVACKACGEPVVGKVALDQAPGLPQAGPTLLRELSLDRRKTPRGSAPLAFSSTEPAWADSRPATTSRSPAAQTEAPAATPVTALKLEALPVAPSAAPRVEAPAVSIPVAPPPPPSPTRKFQAPTVRAEAPVPKPEASAESWLESPVPAVTTTVRTSALDLEPLPRPTAPVAPRSASAGPVPPRPPAAAVAPTQMAARNDALSPVAAPVPASAPLPAPLAAPAVARSPAPVAAPVAAAVAPTAPVAAPAPMAFLSSSSAPALALGVPAPVADPGVRDIHATPASRFDQLAAWLIDAAVLGVLLAACLFTARLIVGQPPPPLGTGLGAVMERAWTWRGIVLPGAALLALFSFVYSSLFHALGGRTPGKRVLGLTLVDTTGQPPPLAVSAGRALLSLLSAAPLMLGFLPLFFDRRRQALHDKLTHTFVVRLG